MLIFESLIRRDLIKRSGHYTVEECKIYFREPPVLAEKKVLDHISEMYEKITLNPHLTITVVDSLDDICRICGKNDGNNCTSVNEGNNKKIDLKVINNYGLIPERKYTSDDLLFKLSRNIYA